MKNRCLSLDFLRGVSIFGMIFSAIVPSGVLPAWMYHIQNPPPTHALDTSVSGISWVDLVFPVFIFCMGAAIPLSGQKKMEKGISAFGYIKESITRFFMLWLFSYLYVLMNFSTAEGFWPQLFTMLGFFALFPLYKVLENGGKVWSICGLRVKKSVATRAVGLLLVLYIITIGHFEFGEAVNVHRRGIIIFLLAFLYLSGSLIWYFTRNSYGARMVIFGLLLIFTFVTKELGWPAATYSNPNIRWWFNMEYFYFLLILIPATLIGDLLGKSGRLPYKQMAVISCVLMVWGLLMIPLEGAITKVPCTISYCFVCCSIAVVMFALSDLLCRYMADSFVVRVFSGAGKNPLMSYIAFDNLVLPLLKITGAIYLYRAAYPDGYHLIGVLRAAVAVFCTMWIVSAFTKKGIFWRA